MVPVVKVVRSQVLKVYRVSARTSHFSLFSLSFLSISLSLALSFHLSRSLWNWNFSFQMFLSSVSLSSPLSLRLFFSLPLPLSLSFLLIRSPSLSSTPSTASGWSALCPLTSQPPHEACAGLGPGAACLGGVRDPPLTTCGSEGAACLGGFTATWVRFRIRAGINNTDPDVTWSGYVSLLPVLLLQ